jgi:hypothetical protein
MNLSLPAVVMFVGGVVLMYAAIKNMTPLDVVRTAMNQKAVDGPVSTGELGAAPIPRQPNPPSNASPGQWVSV